MGVDALSAPVLGRLYSKMGFHVLAAAVAASAWCTPLVFPGGPVMLTMGIALWGFGMGAQEWIILGVVAGVAPQDRITTGYGIFDAGFGFAWFPCRVCIFRYCSIGCRSVAVNVQNESEETWHQQILKRQRSKWLCEWVGSIEVDACVARSEIRPGLLNRAGPCSVSTMLSRRSRPVDASRGLGVAEKVMSDLAVGSGDRQLGGGSAGGTDTWKRRCVRTVKEKDRGESGFHDAMPWRLCGQPVYLHRRREFRMGRVKERLAGEMRRCCLGFGPLAHVGQNQVVIKFTPAGAPGCAVARFSDRFDRAEVCRDE